VLPVVGNLTLLVVTVGLFVATLSLSQSEKTKNTKR
jgi:hypothetical protein